MVACVCRCWVFLYALFAESREERKEMFYLTTHSTHIYGFMIKDH